MKTVLLMSIRSDQGGGPRHVLDLAQHLKRRGHAVYVASPLDAPYGRYFAHDFNGHFLLPHRRFSLLAWLRLAKFIKQKNIQVVHSHGKGAGIYSRLLGLFGIPVVHTFHGLHPKSLFARMLEFFLSFLTLKLICVSSSELSKARKLGIPPAKLIELPNGMDFTRFNQGNPPSKVLGTLSRLDPHKGNLRLIQLMTSLPEEFTLRIAGDGEQREQLRNEISRLGLQNRVSLIGEVSDPVAFLQTISIYVSCSEGEGLPFAILEAVASQKPIVASNVTGHQDLLPKECLFTDDFALKISQAHLQDTAKLKQRLESKYGLNECLQSIAEQY